MAGWSRLQRGLISALGVVFVGIVLVAPVSWLLGRTPRTWASVPPPVWSAQSFASGQAMRDLERHLKEASWVTFHWRGLWNELLLRAGVIDNARVVLGRDRWLLLQETLEWDPAALARSEARRRAVIAEARDLVAARGARLLVIPVPDKTTIYPEQAHAPALPPGRRRLYDTILADLDAVAVPYVDARALLSAHKRAHPEQLLFLERDTHWQLRAMQVVAAGIAPRLAVAGWQGLVVPEPGLVAGEPLGRWVVPDLVGMVGLRVEVDSARDDVPPLVRDWMEQKWDQLAFVSGSPGVRQPMFPEQPRASVALCGSSYSLGFAAPIAIALGAVVDHRFVIGGGGSFRGLRRLLDQIGVDGFAPRVVLWEFVERDYLGEWTRVSSLR